MKSDNDNNKNKQGNFNLSQTNHSPKIFRKEPGKSFITIGNDMHTFYAHDTSHPENVKIWQKLKELTHIMETQYNYKPNVRAITRQLKPGETPTMALMGHSERICFAFALLHIPDGEQITIGKNLRVCDDCHHVFKLFSLITKRVILTRDRKRFHRFENGVCNCNDMW